MRRAGPRPLAAALTETVGRAAPATPLARVQACWEGVVGAAIAAEAAPVAERAGTLMVECGSAVWASELELLAPDLLARLNEELEPMAAAPLVQLRVRAARAR